MGKRGKPFLAIASCLVFLFSNSLAAYAEDLKNGPTPYLVQACPKSCKHGLHPQTNGPFSVFLFCDDAIGSNAGVILTEPGGYPKPHHPISKALKQNVKGDFAWNESNRFWQEKPWSTDVTSFVWSPSGSFLYVATSGMYGDGGLFRLDLGRRAADRIYPPADLHVKGPGYMTKIKSVDADAGEMVVALEAYGEKNVLIDERVLKIK